MGLTQIYPVLIVRFDTLVGNGNGTVINHQMAHLAPIRIRRKITSSSLNNNKRGANNNGSKNALLKHYRTRKFTVSH